MIRVRQIKIPVDNDNELELKKQVSKKLKININNINDIKISKKSLDARYKPDLFYIYEVDISIFNESNFLKKSQKGNKSSPFIPQKENSFPRIWSSRKNKFN